MARILAVCEQADGKLKKVSREAVTAARALADAMGASVDAIILAAAGVETEGLGEAGADRVLVATHASFAMYAPDAFAATIAAQAKDCTAVVVAATAMGKDLAPRLAAIMDAPLAMDVTAVAVEGGKVVATRPIYAGKVIQQVVLEGAPVLVAIRPNTFTAAAAAAAGKAGTVETVSAVEATARLVVKERKAVQKFCIARLRNGVAETIVSAADRMKEAPDLTDAVAGADQRARELGVSGVPFFIFEGTTAVSGAQEAATLLDAIRQARAPTPEALT